MYLTKHIIDILYQIKQKSKQKKEEKRKDKNRTKTTKEEKNRAVVVERSRALLSHTMF